MKKRFHKKLLFLLIVLYGLPGYAQNIGANVKRILFLGNSITYQAHYVNDVEAYLTVHYPGRSFEIINVGLPSETVSGLSEPGHAGGAFCDFAPDGQPRPSPLSLRNRWTFGQKHWAGHWGGHLPATKEIVTVLLLLVIKPHQFPIGVHTLWISEFKLDEKNIMNAECRVNHNRKKTSYDQPYSDHQCHLFRRKFT